MNRTMRVRGKGNLKVRPDMTRVSISLANTCKNYDEALGVSAENSSLLRQIVSKLGFDESDLKTVSFDVDVQNESYRDRNDNWIRCSTLWGLVILGAIAASLVYLK